MNRIREFVMEQCIGCCVFSLLFFVLWLLEKCGRLPLIDVTHDQGEFKGWGTPIAMCIGREQWSFERERFGPPKE